MKTILIDAWNTFVTQDGVYIEMQTMLDQFTNHKIIVTNASEEEKLKLGIVNMPYDVYSLAHNPDKTDPGYFTKLLSEKNLSPSDVVYFEHNLEAVESARSLGIVTFAYDKESRDITPLEEFLRNNL